MSAIQAQPGILSAALSHAARGWRVLPLWWPAPPGCACGRPDCANVGKHPIGELVPHGCHDATTDAEVIRSWWGRFPEANVGIATGQESGIWALDVDPRHGGDVTLEDLETRHGRLPTSLRARTGSGGLHILFAHPRDGKLSNSSGRLGAGLDVRGDGGYIVGPPSRHASGGTYVLLDEEESIVEPAPLWLLELIGERYTEAESDEPVEELPDDQAELVARRKLARAIVRVREGYSRHQTAVWLFQQCRDNRVPRSVARELIDPFLLVCAEKKDRAVPRPEVIKAFAWAFKKAPREADREIDVRIGGKTILEIAAIPSDIERHKAIKAVAAAEAVPVGAVKAEVAKHRAAVALPPPTDWRAQLLWRDTPSGRKLETCLRNAAVFLTHHEQWKGQIRANQFSGAVEWVPSQTPPIEAHAGRWSDLHTFQAAEWLQAGPRLMVGVEIVYAAVQLAAQAAAMHPVREYLESLAWDGEPRLDSWLEDLAGVARTPHAMAVGRRWLVSACARAFRPGAKADHALILEGSQGIGKSTLLRTLFEPWYTDEIDVLGSKDAAMQLRGAWCIEMSELDALHRSDVSRVKAFISRTVDRYRPPYGREVVEAPRGCVFAGSVNDSQYLRDETGGRRFWPVACTAIDLEGAKATRNQLWAEAMVAFRAGEAWWLDTRELVEKAEEEQEQRYFADAWEERIAEVLEPTRWKVGQHVTISNVLTAIGVDTARQDRGAQMRAAGCLKRLGREMVKVKVHGEHVRLWMPKGWKRGDGQ